MTFKKKTVLGIILLILVTSGMFLIKLYRQPLGPPLNLPTLTQSIDPTRTTFPMETLPVNSTATEVPPTFAPTPKPLCGGPAVMNILAIGSDARHPERSLTVNVVLAFWDGKTLRIGG